MTPVEVLAEARRRGIVLSLAGDRLQFDAPKGVLDSFFRNLLVECKADLLTLIEEEGRRQVMAGWFTPVRRLYAALVAENLPTDATLAEIRETEALAFRVISRATPDEIQAELERQAPVLMHAS